MLIVAKPCDSMLDSQILTYPVHEVTPYISWSYFFHAWGVRSSESQSPEVMGLMADARQMLMEMEDVVHPQCLYRLCTAGADGDDLVVEGTRIPLLRQQEPHADGSPLLCLSDFVRPIALGMPDRIGLFAATVHTDRAFPDDPYRNLLLQTLMDRLAEAYKAPYTAYLTAHSALTAAQAVDLRGNIRLGRDTQIAYTAIREVIPTLSSGRNVFEDIRDAYELVRSDRLLERIGAC